MLEPCRWRAIAAALHPIAAAKTNLWKPRRQTPVRRLSSPFVPRRLAGYAVHAASRWKARAAVAGLAARNLGETNAANPARFYWHPYRDSASAPTKRAKPRGYKANPPFSRAAELGKGFVRDLANTLIPCGSLFTNPIFHKTQEPFCAYVRASTSKPTLSNLPASP
jgi:hypothetical protein